MNFTKPILDDLQKSAFIPQSWFIIVFVAWLIWRMTLLEQELIILSKYRYNIAPIRLAQCQANLSPRQISLQKHGFRNRSYLRQYIHEIILQCTTSVGLKPGKGKTNITSKSLRNNLTLIMLIFYTARCPVGIQ